jgi:uncharacterized protein with HEPN domain
MSDRTWPERIRDMLEVVAEIQSFCAGMDREAFAADARTRKAVIADFAILGEAATRMPPAIVAAHPEVPWGLMRGMRNRLVHAYFEVDPAILWQTIRDDLPALVGPLSALLDSPEARQENGTQ